MYFPNSHDLNMIDVVMWAVEVCGYRFGVFVFDVSEVI